VLIFIELRNQDDMDKKISLDCISQRNQLSPAQGKVAQVKIIIDTLKLRQRWKTA
jgi:hypothetical protein